MATSPENAPGEGPTQGSSTSLADRIGLVVGGQFVTSIIGLVQGLLLARLLNKSDFGTYTLLLAVIYGTARDLGLLNIPESILYFAPKTNRGQLIGLVRQSERLLFALGLGVGLLLVGLSFAPGVFLDGRDDLRGLLLLLGLACVLGFPASVYGSVFIATDNHKRAAGISLVMTLAGAAGALVPAALGWPLWSIVALMVANTLLRLALSEWLFSRLIGGVPALPFPGGVRAQLRYVLPLAFTRFAAVFNQKLDKFIVAIFFAAEAFAEFAVGSQELPLVSILPYTIAATMMPKLVELFDKGVDQVTGARAAVELWHTGMRKAAIVMVPVGVFLVLAAEPVIVLLYGEKYQPAALPFRIYSVLLLARITGYGTMLNAFGRTQELMRIQIGGMAVNLAANFVLLPRIGMIAAPLSAVLTQLAMIVTILVRVDVVARLGFVRIFPWNHWLRCLLASSIAGAPVLLLIFSLDHLHAGLLVPIALPLFAATYLFMGSALGVVTADDRVFVRRWLRLEPLRERPARRSP